MAVGMDQGRCRARSPALHVGGRDRVASCVHVHRTRMLICMHNWGSSLRSFRLFWLLFSFPRPRRRDYILRRRASPAAPRRTPSRCRHRRTHMPGKRSGRKARVAVEEESEAILKHSSRKSTRASGSTRSARSKTARVREDKGGGSSRCRRLRLACELLGWGCTLLFAAALCTAYFASDKGAPM